MTVDIKTVLMVEVLNFLSLVLLGSGYFSPMNPTEINYVLVLLTSLC